MNSKRNFKYDLRRQWAIVMKKDDVFASRISRFICAMSSYLPFFRFLGSLASPCAKDLDHRRSSSGLEHASLHQIVFHNPNALCNIRTDIYLFAELSTACKDTCAIFFPTKSLSHCRIELGRLSLECKIK